MTETLKVLTKGMTPSQIGTAISASANRQGVMYTELGLSLLDQGRSPSYISQVDADMQTRMRKFDQKGVYAWLKRWTKNGFTYLETAGKSGDTNEGSLARIQRDVLEQDVLPDYCNIWLGGNDINALQNYPTSEAEVEAMKADLEAIIQILHDNNIKVILSILPNNGLWMTRYNAMYAQNLWEAYCIELGRKGKVAALINYGPLLADPEAVVPRTGVTFNRNSNVVTVNSPGHGLITGNRIVVSGTPNPSFQNNSMPVGFIVTVINPNTFTYDNVGPNAVTIGDFVKVNVLQDSVSDGTTHLTTEGACKAAHMALPIFEKLFPMRDILSASENDFMNLVGVTKTTAGTRWNLGMMYGTGGTKSGSPLPTGVVARSYEVRTVSGNPTSVTCSIEQDDSIAYSQYLWQRIDIVAGASDCEVSFEMAHSKPTNWRLNFSVIAGGWVRPNVENGYFYVNVGSATGTTGTVEPIWPTRVGERVTDGDIVFECRLGFIEGVTKCYAAAAYKIPACDPRAIHAISFGIIDNTTGADSILDFNNNVDPNGVAPYYTAGEEGHFCTPEAVLGASGSSFTIATKIRVAAGKSASVMIARNTWRVV
jgi:hypothetical protein